MNQVLPKDVDLFGEPTQPAKTDIDQGSSDPGQGAMPDLPGQGKLFLGSETPEDDIPTNVPGVEGGGD